MAISWTTSYQYHCVCKVVKGMQNVIKIYQKVQEIGSGSLLSEFEPRQNLDQSQMPFDSLIDYI